MEIKMAFPDIDSSGNEALKKYTVRISDIQNTADSMTVTAKVISRFNFVAHTQLRMSQSCLVEDCSCDGFLESCGSGTCEHCMAMVQYLLRNGYPSLRWGEGDTAAEQEVHPSVPMPRTEQPEEPVPVQEAEKMPELSVEITQQLTQVQDEEPAKQEEIEENGSGAGIPREMHILLGHRSEDGQPVIWQPNDTEKVLHNNIGVIGTMGTGKTQFTKSLITQLRRYSRDNYDGTPVGMLIFDYKGDYNETKPDFVEAAQAMVLKPYRIPYNPFALNLKANNMPLLPLHTANSFADTIANIYNLGPKQQSALLECITAAYQQQGILPADERTWLRPAPTFEMVYRIYESSSAGAVRDSLSAVMTKLHNFVIFEPSPAATVPLMKLLRKTVVLDLSGYDEDIQSLVVAITLDQFYTGMQTGGSSKTDGRYRQLKTFVLVDEADNFMKMGFPSLRKILKEGREFGVGVILSTQSLAHFSGNADDYARYILTWVIHNVNDLNRRDVEFVLKQHQKSQETEAMYMAIKDLKKHESVVKMANDDPVVIQDKPFWQLYQELSGTWQGEG